MNVSVRFFSSASSDCGGLEGAAHSQGLLIRFFFGVSTIFKSLIMRLRASPSAALTTTVKSCDARDSRIH
jgi:hypothetical protein